MISRYTRPEMGKIWTEENKLQKWLEVELAALEGLARLKTRGRFAVPQIIIDAGNRFKLDNDIPQLFIQECCEVNKIYSVSSAVLYQDYKTWCLSNGYKPMSSNTVSKSWERLGFQSKHTKNGNFWQGVRLLTQIP